MKYASKGLGDLQLRVVLNKVLSRPCRDETYHSARLNLALKC